MGKTQIMEMLNKQYGISEQMIERLKSLGFAFYYDMDNTSCLWSKKGEDFVSLERVYEKGFFLNLPPIDDIERAVEALVTIGIDVHIISACVDSPYCRNEKMLWLRLHLPWIKEENIHLCNMGENKAAYVVGDITTAILVDDYKKNLTDFQQAGGRIVKKSYSGKPRPIPFICNHMDIFNVLRDIALEVTA